MTHSFFVADLSTRFHISKYPTLKLMMNGKALKREYRGQRSVESITSHVKGLLKDPVHPISTYPEYQNIEEKKGAIIGYFHSQPATTPGNFHSNVSLECCFISYQHFSFIRVQYLPKSGP